jgi:hypothetical protein
MSRAARLAGLAALTIGACAAALNSTLSRSQARLAGLQYTRVAADRANEASQERTAAALRAPAGSSGAASVAAHMKRAADGGLASAELAAALEQVGPYAPQQRPGDNATPARPPR